MADYATEANARMGELLHQAEATGLLCEIVMNGKVLTWRQWYEFLGYRAND